MQLYDCALNFAIFGVLNIHSMRWMKWIGFLAAVLLIICCYIPWVVIASKEMTISGFSTSVNGINISHPIFGKPGYFHFLLIFFFFIFTFTPRIWAKRCNLFVCAINVAWAFKNYLVISSCQGGECPEKQPAIYLIIAASLIMLLSSFFPDMSVKKES